MRVFLGKNEQEPFRMESKCDKEDYLYMSVPLHFQYNVDKNCHALNNCIKLKFIWKLVGKVKSNQNFIITLNFNMEPEGRGNTGKHAIYKVGEEQSRGFKPVIPIVQPAFFSGDKRPPPFNESDLPIDLKANACFQEYIKLFQDNKNIKTTIEHVNRQKLHLQQKIKSLQSLEKEDAENKKKRHRRNANQIIRSFECPVQNCDKRYGAEASLTQHIKLKHEIYYGTAQFEKFIQDLSKKQKQQSNS